jgi:mRNA interferase MazF
MKQREIWLADLNPVKGSEQRGIRPVVILSGNSMNSNLDVCIVCPISSKIKNYAGCLVLKSDTANGLEVDSEIITFQIRTISGQRLIRKIGEITVKQFNDVKLGLNEILTY